MAIGPAAEGLHKVIKKCKKVVAKTETLLYSA
jgi:hypothetical protein